MDMYIVQDGGGLVVLTDYIRGYGYKISEFKFSSPHTVALTGTLG